ncbi:MAG: TIGR03960 family B12-binding radical SAM protein [Syntrophobacteraceae bacterium]
MFVSLLNGIENPGRYVGCEVNAYGKPFDEANVRFALAFPDVYEVGLSHLGVRLLYHVLNSLPHVMADRVYAPWLDFEKRLRANREPLRGIESDRALGEFDFLGFSLQYELSYTNILTILDLAGIPLESKDRNAGHPWIIAGGPCAFNPEPLARFFDFVVLGEAEQVLVEIVDVFNEWKPSGGTRHEFLREVGKLRGVYVPSFFDVSYHQANNGPVSSIEPLYPGYDRVEKRLILDLDEHSPIPENPLVPMLDIVHNRLSMDIARGCTRGCRFCQAGFIYRPVRERDPRVFLEKTEAALRSSGYEEVSLLSLSAGDYCQIQPLLAAMMDRFAPEKVAVSFPSMRVGTLTPELMNLVKRVRKTGFTLAPEAGSERLRRVINKGILDADLLETAESAFRAGWRLLKLYFMTGLPTEGQSDLDAMADLCLRVWKTARRSKANVNISVSTFVPKPHTPFQWVAQPDPYEIEQRLEGVRQKLNRPGLRFKWSDPLQSRLEAVFARGDRRMGSVLKRAWELGARFDGWSEQLKGHLWMQSFREEGIDPNFYAKRERERDEILPWGHLSTGVEEDFLWNEYERALSEEFTPDCRWSECAGCGVCDHEVIRPRLCSAEIKSLSDPQDANPAENRNEQFLYWMRFSKVGNLRFFGQLETAGGMSRAIRRAGLPAAYSQGFHPHVKLSFMQALPMGFESLAEDAYLILTEEIAPEKVKSLLNRHLPVGMKIEEISRTSTRLSRPKNLCVTYRITGLPPRAVRGILENLPNHVHESIVKKTKRGEVEAKLGQVLLDIRAPSETAMEMDLVENSGMCFRPAAILDKLWDGHVDCISEYRICKISVSPLPGLEEKKNVLRAHHQ